MFGLQVSRKTVGVGVADLWLGRESLVSPLQITTCVADGHCLLVTVLIGCGGVMIEALGTE